MKTHSRFSKTGIFEKWPRDTRRLTEDTCFRDNAKTLKKQHIQNTHFIMKGFIQGMWVPENLRAEPPYHISHWKLSYYHFQQDTKKSPRSNRSCHVFNSLQTPRNTLHFESPSNRAFFQPKARNRSEPLLADFLVGFVQSCDLAEEDGTGGILLLIPQKIRSSDAFPAGFWNDLIHQVTDRDLRSVSLHVHKESTW
jgi:hypothetical protein